MVLHHFGCDQVNCDSSTTRLSAQLVERRMCRESPLHGNDSLCLFNDDA